MAAVPVSRIAAAIEREGFDFIPWAEWYYGGDPSRNWTKLVEQSLPASHHYVHHTVTSATASPVEAARTVNDIGIQRFGKFSYPFLIHSTGAVIQGCYPYIGAHTKGANSTSIAGSNVGNFEELIPSNRMVQANGALIRVLRHLNVLINIPGIEPHNEAPGAQTACPGKHLDVRIPEIARLGMQQLTTPIPPPPPTHLLPPETDMFLVTQKSTGNLWLFEETRRTFMTGPDRAVAIASKLPHLDGISDDAFENLAKNRVRYQ